MKKEIYRTFDGMLDVDNTDGYIIYSIGDDMLEVESISVRPDVVTDRFRVPSNLLPESDFGNLLKLGELAIETGDGVYTRGQTFYNGKWYSGATITEIQKKNDDLNWKLYV